MNDQEREDAIADRLRRIELTYDPQIKKAWFKQAAELIAGRSPEQVAKMERERNLRT